MSETTEEPTFAELVACLPWERDAEQHAQGSELAVRCDCGQKMQSEPMTRPDEVRFGCEACRRGVAVCLR
jgi:hypothetical protein